MNTEVEALWRRLVSERDDDAATRFISVAKRHFPSTRDAIAALDAEGLPGILHGNHILDTPEALEPLKGCVALRGHLQLGPALATQPDALNQLVWISGDLLVHQHQSEHLQELPSLRSVGGRLSIRSCDTLQSLNGLSHLLECTDLLLLANTQLEHLQGLRGLQRCQTLRALLDTETLVHPLDFPRLVPERILLLRWAPLEPGYWHLRRLAAGQDVPESWLEIACQRDAQGDTQRQGLHPSEGSWRKPNEAPVALLGCQVEDRATVILPIYPGRTTIGRGKDGDIVFWVNSLARRHFAIQYQAGEAVAVDHGSTNGVIHNGRRFGRAKLKEGDQLDFGHVRAFYWDLLHRS